MNFATRVAAAVVLAASLAGSPSVAQTNWPDKPVKLVVGFTPGSATDVTARLFAQKFQEAWGQPVVVENIAGNSGAIGTDRVAKAAPDGHTLGLTSNGPLTLAPTTNAALSFHPQRDLAPVTPVASTPVALMAWPGLPARTLPELLALARAQPGALTYSHTGVGNSTHIAGELMKQIAGVDITAVPYSGAMVPDVLAGRVSMTFGSLATAVPLAREGRLRVLGITSRSRVAAAPDVPTFAEQGLQDFEVMTWFGLVAPARVPAEYLERLYIEAARAVIALRPRIVELYAEPMTEAPARFALRIAEETARWAPILRSIAAAPESAGATGAR